MNTWLTAGISRPRAATSEATSNGTETVVFVLRDGQLAGYVALADRIRLLTLDGRIPTDSRLPAERDLGTRLGLSRTTVTAAYRQLREAGYLHSVQGSGSVARLPGTALDPDAPAPPGHRLCPE